MLRAVADAVLGGDAQAIGQLDLGPALGDEEEAQAGHDAARHRKHAIGRADVDRLDARISEDREDRIRAVAQ